jgi:subtilisin family serine protease
MKKRISLWFVVTALVLSISPAALAQSSLPTAKIAPRVMTETQNGKSTEALVVLSEQADLRPAASLPTKEEKGTFVYNTLREVANRTQAPIMRMLESMGVPHQSFYIVNSILVTGGRDVMQQLAARNDVAHIDANPHVKTPLPKPTGVDTNQVDTIEWNITRVKAPDVWGLGYRGEGLVVAGADTGTQWDHPAMKNQYRGWDGQNATFDYNWQDLVQHSPTPIDPHGHGTFTVSEMVGDDGLGNQIGVAPHAKWISCRNMDASGTGSPASYMGCFQFFIAPYPVNGDPNKGDPTKAPHSINNSWICPPSEGCSVNTLQASVEAVRAAGIFPAMAAGNSGPGCSTVDTPPAIYAASVSVGATDSNDNIASFSSRGPVTADNSNRIKPNLSAPGANIRGAVPGNGYQSGWSGTSMATPHVAASVALLWQAKPSLKGDIDTTQRLLQQNTVPGHYTSVVGCGITPGNRPNNQFGWGLLNILNAVQAP